MNHYIRMVSTIFISVIIVKLKKELRKNKYKKNLLRKDFGRIRKAHNLKAHKNYLGQKRLG